MWGYAERFGLPELVSEDFQNGRLYGTVLVRDPFPSSPEAAGWCRGSGARH